MSYSKQTWYDNESGGTPITAEKLNHMEQGIYDNAEAWDSISLTKEIELASGVVLFVLGKIGIIRFGISLSNISWNWKTVATVDELYKPISTFTSCLKGEQAANVNGAFYAANARIQEDGTVSVNPGNYANESISGELVYIIA